MHELWDLISVLRWDSWRLDCALASFAVARYGSWLARPSDCYADVLPEPRFAHGPYNLIIL